MAAPKARDIANKEADFLRSVFTDGWQRAIEAYGFTAEEARRLLADRGLSPEQAAVLEQIDVLKQAGVISLDPKDLPANINDLVDRSKALSDEALYQLRNPQSAQQLETVNRALALMRGEGEGQRERITAGQDILRARGRTPEMDFLTKSSQDIIKRGGSTDDLDRIKNFGISLAQAGGFTPELRNVLGESLTLLRSAGQLTPELREVFDLSITIAKGGKSALLPVDKIIEFAREDAAQATQSNFLANVREAQRRGGGPGALFSGPQGNILAEAADQSARNEAQAVRDALTKQQVLTLQERQSALNSAGDAAKAGASLESSRLNTSASLLGDVMRTASANLGTGLGAATNAESIAAGRLANAGSLGLGVENAATNRLGLGADILSNFTQQQLAAGGIVSEGERNRLNAIAAAGNLAGAANQDVLGTLGLATGIQQQNFQNQMGVSGLQLGVGQQSIENQLRALGLIDSQGNAFTSFGQGALDASSRSRLAAAQFQSQPGVFASTILPMLIQGGIGAASAGLGGGFGGGGNSSGLGTNVPVL